MAYIKIYPNDTDTGTATDITSLAQIDNVKRPRAAVNSIFAGDTDGNTHLVTKLTRPVITMDAWVMGTASQRRTKLAALMEAVTFTEPRALKFEDDGQWYYTVVPQGAREVDDFTDSSCVHLSFESVYPWQWGEEIVMAKAALTANAGIVTDGNWPAIGYMKTNNSITTDASGVWGFTISTSGKRFQFSGLTASTTYNPTIDTLKYTANISGNRVPDALSNAGWPIFPKGAKLTSITGDIGSMRIRPRRV